MIKAAELLFKAPQAEKPTILLLIDRNELEDQMLRNLAMRWDCKTSSTPTASAGWSNCSGTTIAGSSCR